MRATSRWRNEGGCVKAVEPVEEKFVLYVGGGHFALEAVDHFCDSDDVTSVEVTVWRGTTKTGPVDIRAHPESRNRLLGGRRKPRRVRIATLSNCVGLQCIELEIRRFRTEVTITGSDHRLVCGERSAVVNLSAARGRFLARLASILIMVAAVLTVIGFLVAVIHL
jgi:hypothetical protein